MPKKFRFKIKNWKLAILAWIFICIFAGLGFWQLSRAHQKEVLLKSFTDRTLETPRSAKELSTINDWRFYRVKLTGTFDNKHTFLLDNKTQDGKIGYEVYTPFHAKGMNLAILVNRGFIALSGNRTLLPSIKDISGETTVIGMLNLPPLYRALGPIKDSNEMRWPLRIEFINLADLSKILNTSLFPYILIMGPKDPRAYATSWNVNAIPPERHKAYAIQWFALALTLLILFVALNRA